MAKAKAKEEKPKRKVSNSPKAVAARNEFKSFIARAKAIREAAGSTNKTVVEKVYKMDWETAKKKAMTDKNLQKNQNVLG
jgi:hypothetical protein